MEGQQLDPSDALCLRESQTQAICSGTGLIAVNTREASGAESPECPSFRAARKPVRVFSQNKSLGFCQRDNEMNADEGAVESFLAF